MALFAIIIGAAIAAVTPLSDEHREALQSALDGSDQRDGAFAALLENVRQWSPELGGAAVHHQQDIGQAVAQPHDFRGELFRIEGRIEQQSTLPSPHEDVTEWFVRQDEGRPVMIYVVTGSLSRAPRDGERVVVTARFYKQIELGARDGQVRPYPAFVGAVLAGGESGGSDRSVFGATGRRLPGAAALIALLSVFAILLVFVRKSRGAPRSRLPNRAPMHLDDHEEARVSLPADPAEALAELHRRAQS